MAVAAVALAVLLAAAASLPAVWWEPLHLDEAVTLQYAPAGPTAILEDVFVERGGAPVFFLVEYATLGWPGGLEGLRLPSLLFFLAAVVLAAPVARELGGREAGLLVPLLLAVAPLALRLSTFARMYALFLAGVLLAVWLLLRAVERERRGAWILAGAVSGSLVYVHPIAPLYIGLALATAYLLSGSPPRRFLRVARPGLLTLAAVAAPYLYALTVLGRRYGVGSSESTLAATSSGRSVPEESVLALGFGGTVGAALLAVIAVAGLIATLRRDRRRGIALGLWVVVPIAFFTLVPSETTFFARYLLPALPFFLLLVVLGCLAAGRAVGRPLPVAVALVAIAVAWEAVEAASRLERLRGLRLGATVDSVARADDAVVFSSTGAPLGGRPAELLDAYVALELREIRRMDEFPGADPANREDVLAEGIAAVRAFLASEQDPGRGVWIFSGAPRRLDLAARRLESEPDLEVRRASPSILLVSSRRPLGARALVEQAVTVRTAWLGERGRDRLSRVLADIDRKALDGAG